MTAEATPELDMVHYLLTPGPQEGVIGLAWLKEHVWPGLEGQFWLLHAASAGVGLDIWSRSLMVRVR